VVQKHATGVSIEARVTEEMARVIVWAGAAYVGSGLLFAIAFVTTGVQRLDAAARGAGWGFRALIVPGVTLLWPLLAVRWVRGSVHPPREVNAHRRAASRGRS
jgi:hypothetical protein